MGKLLLFLFLKKLFGIITEKTETMQHTQLNNDLVNKEPKYEVQECVTGTLNGVEIKQTTKKKRAWNLFETKRLDFVQNIKQRFKQMMLIKMK